MHRLELTDLNKTFKNKTAVRDISVSLEHGVYGLLGENGAGKTTLMRMLCGILEPTSVRSSATGYRSVSWEAITGCS